ncbi:Putative amino acid efflux protein YcgF [Halomicronema hongdechloris C2206]|uniref:Amino acid efflux protein YcgF n=1 Tax=Halomicronema hongdechloris C2206 TaxID=1641165 RepID=A0A1Z3HT49_9CYAN|nr:LysE family transporter [Halomicronema hongdechloris]ASC73474.1 Putative amino acid efflux protein YcgF [Halomicronema hongdechloris C2206]
MHTLFLQGLILGLSIAAPVGPIGILCIRRTLTQGQWVGLLSGLGAATADGIYGGIAAFGLTAVSQFLVDQATWLTAVGGVFLIYLGIKTGLSRPAEAVVNPSVHGWLGAYGSTLFLTLTNPATIVSFVAIFAGLGLAAQANAYGAAMVLVLGVFLGSALWWLLLSWSVNLFRAVMPPARLRWLNRGAGLVLIAFGVIALSLRG